MERPDDATINELVANAKEGDRKAFSEIVRLTMPRVYALTYKMTGDPDGAKDLAQDVFVAAWRKIGSFKGESRLESWLYRIASNLTLNYLKQNARRQEALLSEPELRPSQISDDPARSLEQDELRKGVLLFMEGLPPVQRLVFELRFYKQLSFREIASATDKAEGSVKTSYREAVAKLRAHAEKKGWKA